MEKKAEVLCPAVKRKFFSQREGERDEQRFSHLLLERKGEKRDSVELAAKSCLWLLPLVKRTAGAESVTRQGNFIATARKTLNSLKRNF